MKETVCDAARTMRQFALILAAFSLLLAGCAGSRVTNLTTTKQPRNPSSLYPIEFAWDSNQQTIIPGTIQPYVVVGFEKYPMRPALNIANRWETVIPVPPEKDYVVYHFKVDYQYRTFGKPQQSSKLSPSYRLDIVSR
jgi:uncharacterized protein YceK